MAVISASAKNKATLSSAAITRNGSSGVAKLHGHIRASTSMERKVLASSRSSGVAREGFSSKLGEGSKKKRNPPKCARRYADKSSCYIGVSFYNHADFLIFLILRAKAEQKKQIYLAACSSEEAAARYDFHFDPEDPEDVRYVFEEKQVCYHLDLTPTVFRDRLPTSTAIKASSRSSSSRIKTSKGAKKKAREIVASSKREEAGTRKRNPPKSARRYTNKSSPCIGSGGRRTFGYGQKQQEDLYRLMQQRGSRSQDLTSSSVGQTAQTFPTQTTCTRYPSGSISPTRSSSTSGQSLLWFTPELLAYGAGTRETRPRASNHNGVYLLKNRKAPWAASITLKLHYLSVKLDLSQQKTFSIRTLWFSSLPQAEASYDSTELIEGLSDSSAGRKTSTSHMKTTLTRCHSSQHVLEVPPADPTPVLPHDHGDDPEPLLHCPPPATSRAPRTKQRCLAPPSPAMAAVELASAACSDSSSSWAAQSETEEDGSEEPANSSLSTDGESGDDDHPVIATEKREAPSMATRAVTKAATNLASSQPLDVDTMSSMERSAVVTTTPRMCITYSRRKRSISSPTFPSSVMERRPSPTSLMKASSHSPSSKIKRCAMKKTREIVQATRIRQKEEKPAEDLYIKFHGNYCPNFPYSDYEHKIPQIVWKDPTHRFSARQSICLTGNSPTCYAT
ncbi:hypothetical protein SELMODRAFT_428825 [Selaginella moellendorffii]|uniref:Uncharacterized protein n=1 Tax=Selaginella moellendorffii TaxID=88036 RepID=D8T447_SELML|nr:hypothetical protein SELMODRAFT_428825 [Selaginella moellendorffii]